MRRLMLLVILCGGVSAGSHSLHYFYTAMSPIPGVPDFVVVGYMDDVQIVYYDSVRKEMIPSQRWIAENEGPAYWERYTREAQEWEQWGRANIQILMKKTNQTSVFHTYQRTWGCDLHTDGSTNAFTVFGWDGQDFLFFDKEKMLWQTALPLANSAKKQCDGFKSDNQYWKSYLEQECISNLKKYLKTGERALSVVPPQVFITVDKVTDTNPDQLSCLVTGFYPGQIEVTLLRNGEPITDTFSTGVLPNHNDSYQLRRWSQINPEDGATYSCQFEQGEKGAETRDWDGTFRGTPRSPEGTNLGLIIGIVVAVGALIAVAIGVAVWKERGGKNRAGYSSGIATEKEKSSSNSSVQA